MKKIYLFIITALFLYVITAACKKDKNDTDGDPVASFPKIDSVIDYQYNYIGDIAIYKYDSKGRVVRILYKDGSSDSLIYSDTQVLWKYYWPGGSLDAIDTYMLNSKGLATMVIFDSGKKERSSAVNLPKRMNFNSNTSSLSQLLREYDANGYMVKETYYIFTSSADTATYWYTIKNGNINGINGISTNQSNPYSITETFSYYTDKQNTIGDQNSGIAFLGKQNNNLVKTLLYNLNNYSPPDTLQYWYKFDSKNRVIMSYSSLTLGSYVDSTRYTYKN
jgi:hypothetical protein